MITNVSLTTPRVKSTSNVSPSFGLARLNEKGINAVDKFGYQKNSFLDSRMFEQQGLFSKSALTKKLANGSDFAALCTKYGCTNNAKTNAQFIKTQILSGKSKKAINNVEQEQRQAGLVSLFKANYDNPRLTVKETKALLEEVKDAIGDEEYVKFTGLLDVGADN